MHLAFLGWGTAVPEGTLIQEEALELARSLCPQSEEQLNWLPKWYSQTGIKTRGIILLVFFEHQLFIVSKAHA